MLSLKHIKITNTTNTMSNKAFIDIRLRPGIAPPLVVVGYRFSLPRIAIRPTMAKHDVIHKTGST